MAHGGHMAFPSRGLSSGPELTPPLQSRNHINRHSWQVSYEEMSGNLETGEQGKREDFAQLIINRLLGWGLVLTFTETQNDDTVVPLYYHLLSPANMPGTVLSALCINYHKWSYQLCWK